jgi:hypothetical protein
VSATLALAVTTSILRDAGNAPRGDEGEAPESRQESRSFSLGRTQMALWTCNVVIAFLYLRAITGEIPAITPTTLALLGIGSGAGLGAALIDDSKRSATVAALVQEQANLQGKVATLSGDAKREAEGRLSTLPAEIADTKRAWKTEGWINDLLTDANGYSLHRFQMVIWTLVLTFVFWGSVVGRLCMPEFDATLLALMGISSGVYLGFKLPEKQAPGGKLG